MKICQKKIIALNLQNAILENVESWFSESDLVNSSDTKQKIKQLLEENLNSDKLIEYVFLINDVILGTSDKKYCSEINYSNFLIDDFVLLKPISLAQLESYRSVVIDWIYNYHKKNKLAFMAIQILQEFESVKHRFPNFTSCVCVVDVVDLGFKLNDFFTPLNNKFKQIHYFFKTYYQTNRVLKNVNLTKVFFIDQLVLGFTFQMEGSDKEHFFWNKQLDEQLLLMDKITFDKPIQLTVDGLLDKIHLKGIESLTETEINFLNNQ